MHTINYPVTIDVKLLLKRSDTLSVDQNIDILIDSGITKQKDIKLVIQMKCNLEL
jgi:hypothetical protein